MGLDNEFTIIRKQILATNPIPSLGNAYHLVVEDKRQRAISAKNKPSMEVAAFKTNTSVKWENKNPSQCHDKQSQKEVKSSDALEHCSFCGKHGHTREVCFKGIGYPKWWPGNQSNFRFNFHSI